MTINPITQMTGLLAQGPLSVSGQASVTGELGDVNVAAAGQISALGAGSLSSLAGARAGGVAGLQAFEQTLAGALSQLMSGGGQAAATGEDDTTSLVPDLSAGDQLMPFQLALALQQPNPFAAGQSAALTSQNADRRSAQSGATLAPEAVDG